MTEAAAARGGGEAEPVGVEWLADYVYGTISTLISVTAVSFRGHPRALPAGSVIVAGAIAIWLAHTLARLVTQRAWHHLELGLDDIRAELWGSWSILLAAVPAVLVFLMADLHVWSVSVAFFLTNALGVVSLAVVGVITAGGAERPLRRRVLYVAGLVAVGLLIVVVEGVARHF